MVCPSVWVVYATEEAKRKQEALVRLKLTLKLAKEAKWKSFCHKDNNFLISEVRLATRASAWGQKKPNNCLKKKLTTNTKKPNKNPKHITLDIGDKRIKDYVSFALVPFTLSLPTSRLGYVSFHLPHMLLC